MRHRVMRRNESFRLQPPPEQQAVLSTIPSIGGLTTLGVVINPKLKQPLLVVTDGEYISIRSLMADTFLRRIGRGYTSESKEAASAATGYPRVHTPDGVKPEGMGYGTSLYSALCLGAHLDFHKLVDIRMSKHGNGICSDTRDRTEDADRWWSAAVSKGLAEEDTEEETLREENIDVTREVDAEGLQRIIGDDREVVYVNDVNVDFEKTETLTFEYMTHSSLTDHHLVCGEVIYQMAHSPRRMRALSRSQTGGGDEDLSLLWHAMLDDPEIIYDTFEEPLLALDVRGLHEDSVNFLSLLYLAAGLSDSAVDEMQQRWRQNLDPDEDVRQGQLFRANAAGMADVVYARRATRWDELESLP